VDLPAASRGEQSTKAVGEGILPSGDQRLGREPGEEEDRDGVAAVGDGGRMDAEEQRKWDQP
jgi:hypothetical protein